MRVFPIITILALGGVIIAAASCSQDADGQEPQDHQHAAGGHQEHQKAAAHQEHDHSAHEKPAPSVGTPSQGASDPVLDSYITIQKALAADSTTGVAAAATSLSKAATTHKSHGGSHGEVASGLIQASSAFQGADLAAARTEFKTLSQQMIRYREIMPAVLSQTYVIHCSMANASWVQITDQVANPYEGSSMPRCGDVTKQRGAR